MNVQGQSLPLVTAFLLKTPQRIERIHDVFKSLRETILVCNGHFDNVIRDARAIFITDNARQALDKWIFLVSDASEEIRKAYSKSKTGAFGDYE